MLANLASAIDHEAASTLRDGGIPVLEGTSSGLVAIGHLLRLATETVAAPEPLVDVERQARWRTRLADPTPLRADESFALLADYGLPVVHTRQVDSSAAAVAAAQAIGCPVVVKTAASTLAHKTDVGAVVLGVRDDDHVRTVYDRLAAQFGPEVTVSATAPAGVEIALGLAPDPFSARSWSSARAASTPISCRTLQCCCRRSRRSAYTAHCSRSSSMTCSPVVGAPPADVELLVDAVVALGLLARELGDDVTALDVNPIIASPGWCGRGRRIRGEDAECSH